MSGSEANETIWDTIKAIGVGMLTSRDGDLLRARPMQLVQKDYDGTIWFFVKASNHKTAEIWEERPVNLSFGDPAAGDFVSLAGMARLCLDPVQIDRLWGPQVAAWYPGGKWDRDVALLEIRIRRGEYWDARAKQVIQFFEKARATIVGGATNIGGRYRFA